MAETEGFREIDIRLTRDRSFLSYLIYFMGFGGLTHAAIGLDREDEFFYSFNTKGFRKEYLHPRRKRLLNTATYRIRVSEESYQNLKNKLVGMYENREDYGYNGFGVAMCFSRLPFRIRFKKKYFCSQFVAESLTECGCNRIGRELKKSDQLVGISYTKDLVPVPLLLVRQANKGRRYVISGVNRRVLRPTAGFFVKYGYNPVLRPTVSFLYRYGYLPVAHAAVPFLKKPVEGNIFRRFRVRLNLLHYMRKIRKICVYLMYEQYKEIFSKGEENG